MKRAFIVFLSGFFVLFLGVLACQGSRYACSQRLVKAIMNGDRASIESILSKRPAAVNTMTSPFPQALCSLFDDRSTYPLIAACGAGDMETVVALVEHGADVNCSDGRTPLSITYSAKPENWYEISTYLLSKGAALDYRTEYSPDDASVLCDIVQVRPGARLEGYIAEDPAEVSAAFQFAVSRLDPGQVPWSRVLQHAVSNDRYEIVSWLIETGLCGVNDAATGMTPLMFAARDSTADMVALLLSCGADAALLSADGKTAHDYAVLSGNHESAALLASDTLPE